MTSPTPAPTPQAGQGGTNPTTTTPEPPVDPAAPWGDDANFDPERAKRLIANLHADKTKLQTQVAELTPYQQQVRALEDAQKSEAVKLQEQLAAAQKLATDNAALALRTRIARDHGITAADEALFMANVADEGTLTQIAQALQAKNGATAAPGVPPTTPVEQLRPGALPTPPPTTLADQIAAAEKAGDWNTARSLKSQQLLGLFDKIT